MKTLDGKNNEAIIFTDEDIDSIVSTRITDLLNTKMTNGLVVRIMPNVCSSFNNITGYTQTYSGELLDPDIISDYGCGVLAVKYKLEKELNLELIKQKIKRTIPIGNSVNKKLVVEKKEFYKFIKRKLEKARSLCPSFINYEGLNKIDKLIDQIIKKFDIDEDLFWHSLGTLGGGDHFIELGQEDNDKNSIWVIIHTGSRNLGSKFQNYWKKLINKTRILKEELKEAESNIKMEYRGDHSKIKEELVKLHDSGKFTIPPSRFITTREDVSDYLCDSIFIQSYAEFNRLTILNQIVNKKALKLGKEIDKIDSIHNYIDPLDLIIRKGAIKLNKGESTIITLNQNLGSIIVESIEDNANWNFSVPSCLGKLSDGNYKDIELFKKELTTVRINKIIKPLITIKNETNRLYY